MITAVDSSALLNILHNVVVCPIVWAELRGSFADATLMERSFAEARIAFDPFDRECADIASAQWHEYRRRGGSRTRLIADFFIGAHAQRRGGRLITRDRGFYRRYFDNLTVIDGVPFNQ